MTSLNRVLITWSGPQVVGGGVTVLHYAGDVGGPPIPAIKAAFSAAAKLIPAGVTLTVPGTGDVIDDTTGILSGVWSVSGGLAAQADDDHLLPGRGGRGRGRLRRPAPLAQDCHPQRDSCADPDDAGPPHLHHRVPPFGPVAGWPLVSHR